MSKDLECPKCLELFDYDGDSEGFSQDSEQEFECPYCKTEVLATVYWQMHFTGERMKSPSTPEGGKEE